MIIYGHRGARGEAPENTTEGFKFASNQGIKRFELDIQLSKDGRMIVMHDASLKRTTGLDKKVFELSSQELRNLDARQNTAPWSTFCHIPILDDLLDEFNSVEHWQLEVKSDDKKRLNILCNRLLEFIHERDLVSKVVVTSSDKWFLKEIRRRDKKVLTGLVAEKRFPHPVKSAMSCGCHYLCINVKLCDKQLVEEAHAKNMIVSCWTVNSLHEAVILQNMGVDSIITDYPTSTTVYFEKKLKYTV